MCILILFMIYVFYICFTYFPIQNYHLILYIELVWKFIKKLLKFLFFSRSALTALFYPTISQIFHLELSTSL